MNVPFIIQKIFGSVTWRMPGSDPVLFLSFDDGPVPEVTPLILDILKKFNAKATFFCVGDNIQKHPELFRRIKQEGHVVGNHTFSHLNGWQTRSDVYSEDVMKCEAVMKTEEGIDSKLFRPPYGKLKRGQIARLRKNFTIVMWDVLSRDYDQKISGEKCFQTVTADAKPGSIVVFHDSIKAKERVLFALPKVLEHFSEKNFSFRSINL
jgi:peptidoglycan/xylan/chitin deacetylase (PgdA/CDA1 family)